MPQVLHGIELHADKGSVITVIGPNGAGKSTLLNTVMGILPGQGTIEFRGQDISTLTLEERVMNGMALVPEKRELFSTMPVEDNLLLGGFRQMRLGPRRQLKVAGPQLGPATGVGESPSWSRHRILIPACEGSSPSSPARP